MENEFKISDPIVEGESPTGSPSMLDALKAQYAKIEQRKDVTIPVQGWGGMLHAKYRILSAEELELIGNTARHGGGMQSEIVLRAVIATLIDGCTGIYFSENGRELVPIRDDSPDPICWDHRLAAFLGWDHDVESATDLVYKVFGGNESQILEHGRLYSRWLSDTSAQVGESFLGELI